MAATLKPDLRDGIAGLSALTSASTTVGINRSKQGTDLPRVVINRRGYGNTPTLEVDDDEFLIETFLVTVRGKTDLQAETLADAIMEYLESLSGDIGSARRVVGTHIEQVADDFEDDFYGGDAGAGVVAIQATIQHQPQ